MSFEEPGLRLIASSLQPRSGKHWKTGCKNTAVSDEDFVKDPTRNRLVSRDQPHKPRFVSLGQAILANKRITRRQSRVK
jgi:hypothetical protein